jgi:hypothetical protein
MKLLAATAFTTIILAGAAFAQEPPQLAGKLAANVLASYDNTGAQPGALSSAMPALAMPADAAMGPTDPIERGGL